MIDSFIKQALQLLTLVMSVAVLTVTNLFAGAELPPLRTVERVDLQRYLGVWYEIARYPNRFQKDCRESRAVYSLRDNGEIEVVNQCTSIKDGSLKEAKGNAWPVDETNSRLKVSFFWPFRGDYWIMELGSAYEYAVIGTPNRKFFWILSRKPVMDNILYQEILLRAKQQGYDPSAVIRQ